MTYLFVKGGQHVACEVAAGAEPALRLTIAPLRVELTERFPSASRLRERWIELRNLLDQDGWAGPLGQ